MCINFCSSTPYNSNLKWFPQQSGYSQMKMTVNTSAQKTQGNPSSGKIKNNHHNLSKILICAGGGLAILAGACIIASNGARFKYFINNFGKKGINNFVNDKRNIEHKHLFDFLSKDSSIKAELDKLSVANINEIVPYIKLQGVKDLMLKRAEITSEVITTTGKSKKPIIEFNNKSGFDLLNEIKRAGDYFKFMITIEEKLSKIHKKYPDVMPLLELKNLDKLNYKKNTKQLEISNSAQLSWLVHCIFRKNDDKLKFYRFSAPLQTLLDYNCNHGNGFEEFFNKFIPKNAKAVSLRFNNFNL